MTDYSFRPEDIINARERFAPPPKRVPRIDIPISKVVGRNIVMGTPDHRKIVGLIAGWDRKRGADDVKPVDHLKDPAKVAEIKKLLN